MIIKRLYCYFLDEHGDQIWMTEPYEPLWNYILLYLLFWYNGKNEKCKRITALRKYVILYSNSGKYAFNWCSCGKMNEIRSTSHGSIEFITNRLIVIWKTKIYAIHIQYTYRIQKISFCILRGLNSCFCLFPKVIFEINIISKNRSRLFL